MVAEISVVDKEKEMANLDFLLLVQTQASRHDFTDIIVELVKAGANLDLQNKVHK